MRRAIFAALAAALAIGAAEAQVAIDKRRPASQGGAVYVHNSFGSIKVTGWDNKEVWVTGTLAAGGEFSFDGDKESVSIEISPAEGWSGEGDDDADSRSTLEVRVPKGSTVDVESVNASIGVEGVEGSVNAESTNGAVVVSGRPRDIRVETITGSIEMPAETVEVQAESVSGAISLRGAARRLELRSVSGSIGVAVPEVENAGLETVSGEVTLKAGFAKDGHVRVETHSGDIVVALPASAAARFRLQTFSGKIQSAVGPRPRRVERYNPYQELRFSTSLDTSFEVDAETFNGNITVTLEGGALRPAPSPASPSQD